jgi:hypothetical protein
MTDGKPERVQRKRTKGWKMPPNTVYVGRPTRWGNPHDWQSYRENFPPELLQSEGPGFRDNWCRERAVEAYQEDWSDYLRKESAALTRLRAALGGKDLACWCGKHSPCHADILLHLANDAERTEK